MKALFLGTLYPENRIAEIKINTSYFDAASDTFQKSLIVGLEKFLDLEIITAPALKRYKNHYFKGSKFSHNGASNDICLSEVTIPAIKELRLSHSFYDAIKKKSDIDIIFVYSTSYQALYAAAKYKLKNKSVKIINIIADLPQFMSSRYGVIYGTLKSVGVKLYNRYTKYVDGYVLLAPKMTELLPINGRPWICVEGIFNNSLPIVDSDIPSDEKIVLYTGSLSKRYGIIDLLDGFSMIPNKNYRLYFCGRGGAEETIKERSLSDPRIKYLGLLPREEVLQLQKKATLLVNPRSSKEAYTKYSFPSKTMEYMASGTPVLMSHIECLPEEYNQYLFFIEEETPQGIKKRILDICEKNQEELSDFGARASSFILKKKNSVVQAGRIMQLISTL